MEFIKRNIKLIILSGHAGTGKGEVSDIITRFYKNKKVITISFGHYIKDYAKRVSNWDGSTSTKPRELLQQLGIELIKNKIDNRLFINRIIEDIEVFSYFYDIIIVNDARLLDEILTLKEKYPDSKSIRILRNNYDNGLKEEEKKHLTETDLDNYTDFDFVINNDSSKEDLKKKIEKVLSEE